MRAARPIVWSVAGSDSGGGAGLQADLRAFDAFGVHGCTVVAALTAQNSARVTLIEPVSQAMFEAQLSALAEDMPPRVIKTGMLGNVANVRSLVRCIDMLRLRDPQLKLVVDPVLGASTGVSFADPELMQAYRDELLPRADLVTPNRLEAAMLLGLTALESREEVEQAAKALHAIAPRAALMITGGDAGGSQSEDFALAPWASGWLTLQRIATPHHHGTGCVLASSAAAALALGFVAIDAMVLAKMATSEALRASYAAGQGAGPVAPRASFAREIDNLPRFAPEILQRPGFAPLREPRMGLYAVVDSAEWVQRVLAEGVRTVQLRIKDPATPDLRQQIRASVSAAQAAGAQLFINDHWQLAIEEKAYGVHLGQEDLETADLAALREAGLRLGLSSHSPWEVCRAWAVQPSYIACGPIHPTAAKAMPWIAQGNGNLAYWSALLPIPVVAIGGMDVERATQAAACGAASVAVISAITAAADPVRAIADLQRAIETGWQQPRWPAPALPATTLAG